MTNIYVSQAVVTHACVHRVSIILVAVKEEIKGLKRIYVLEYFELAFYLGGMLLLKHIRGRVVPNSPHMTTLVTVVIGKHF